MVYRTRIKYTAAHDCKDLGTPLRGVQDDSMDGGVRVVSGTTTEVERIRTNIGYIRVKMPGADFPDRVDQLRSPEKADVQL